jgi:hypothetical protein
MSHTAIAAALACQKLSLGERQVAFSLASYAAVDLLPWPGNLAAAARAGLSDRQFLQARARLVRRGLLEVERSPGGRGKKSTVDLVFAREGPWWEGDINAQLFGAVLGYSRARGPARLLLAAMAALADEDGVLEELTTEELCRAAGIAEKTYREARKALLRSGELVLLSGGGGRGRANRWQLRDPRVLADGPIASPGRERVAPPQGARPLLTATTTPDTDQTRFESSDANGALPTGVSDQKGGTARTLSNKKGAGETGVSERNGGVDRTLSEKGAVATGVREEKGGVDRTLSAVNRAARTGVSARKGGAKRTVSRRAPGETPAERGAETPAETPAANARAGKEPQNPRTPEHPPFPPEGGRESGSISIEHEYRTARGRLRRRAVTVDLDGLRATLRPPAPGDAADWRRIRELMAERVEAGTPAAVWVELPQLVAVDVDGALLVACPPRVAGWLMERFWPLIARCAADRGRGVRLADEAQHAALLGGGAPGAPAPKLGQLPRRGRGSR